MYAFATHEDCETWARGTAHNEQERDDERDDDADLEIPEDRQDKSCRHEAHLLRCAQPMSYRKCSMQLSTSKVETCR
jgi:hypothetical protein